MRHPTTGRVHCDGLCAHQMACDSSIRKSECNKDCNERGVLVSYAAYRSEYVKRLASCIDDASCEKLDGDVCEEEAAAGIHASDVTTSFCSALTVQPSCGLGISNGACLEKYKLYDDAVLSAARKKCKDQPCEAKSYCVLGALAAAR